MSSEACKKALACRQKLQRIFFEKITGFDAIATPKIRRWKLCRRNSREN
jgi:hypothetical protein